ncbi:MAG: ABC transporter ATP-binding protein [Moraxellaceae bacterium]
MLKIDTLTVRYGDHAVVRDISLTIANGGIGCLLGPSGCGKTTLLRAIAGFEPVAAGSIRLDDDVVSRPGHTLAPEKRGVGMVFQDLALFPHLSVADNIGFGLRGMARAERRARIDALLALVGLDGRGGDYPHLLSGGQQQRVALARALAPRPRLLLLDEPFSSLDSELRESLARDVRQILKHENITALLVTHDQFEAFAMADHIAVMRAGRIQQQDTAYTLYHQPADRFVADFVGQGSLLPGTVVDAHHVDTALGRIAGNMRGHHQPGERVDVLVRPDDLLLDPEGALRATVTDRAFRGALFLYTLRLADGSEVLAQTPSHVMHEIGADVGLRPDFDHLAVFSPTA